MNDIRVPELNGEGQFLSPAVIAHIEEIATSVSPPVDLSGEGDFSVAIGVEAEVTNWHGVALGHESVVASEDWPYGGVAIGQGSKVTGGNSMAIGDGALAAGHDSAAIGRWAVADNDNELVLGRSNGSYAPDGEVGYSLPYYVRVPGTLLLDKEPEEDNHAATKKYVDEKAGGGGGLPGIASGPGRPDYPNSMDDPLPHGTVMYVSTNQQDGSALWTRGDNDFWYPVNAQFGAQFTANSGLTAATITLDPESFTIAQVTPISAESSGLTLSLHVGEGGQASIGIRISRPSSSTINVPEGGYLAVSLPNGYGLSTLVPAIQAAFGTGRSFDTQTGGTWTRAQDALVVPIYVGSFDGREYAAIADLQGESPSVINGKRGFRMTHFDGNLPFLSQWPHIPRLPAGVT